MKRHLLTLSVLVPSLCMLPSCDFMKNESAPTTQTNTAESTAAPASQGMQSDVLLTINGKPKMTVAQYEAYVADIIKMQPQFKQILSIMPRAERELCQNYSIEIILQEWVEKNKIDQSAMYQEDLKRGTELLKRQLALKYFQEEYPKKAKFDVTDAQALAWYNENKDKVQPILISRGGVNAQAVQFDKEDAAKAFFDKVKGGAKFDVAAKDANVTVKQLRQVGAQSIEVEPAVREKLDQIKTFPSVEMIKSNGKVWVVQALNKEQPKYHPFEELKDEIKQQLRMQEIFTKGVEQVKKELNVVENTDYFEKKEKQCEADLAKLREEAMKEDQKAQNGQKGKAPAAPQMPIAPGGQASF